MGPKAKRWRGAKGLGLGEQRSTEGEVEKERVSLGAPAEPYLEKRRCGSYWT